MEGKMEATAEKLESMGLLLYQRLPVAERGRVKGLLCTSTGQGGRVLGLHFGLVLSYFLLYCLKKSMFEKADADLDQISRKLDAEFANETDEASGQVNKGELLEKISDIRKEYAEVVKEAQAIQDTQREAMEFFKGELTTLCGALTKLQFTVGMDGEPSSEELQKVSHLLGVPLPDDIPQSGLAVTGGTSEECTGETDCSSKKAGNKTSPLAAETNAGVDFKIEMSPHEKRANSNEFMELNDTEFQSVSSLVRGRVKLSDVNHTYRILWQHFKEEGNIDPLSQSDLFKMGLRVTGHTGEAKLKVLKSLKLLTISKKGDVKLL